MRRTLLYTNYLISCRLSTDPEMYDLGWLWMAWMFIIRNSLGCGQCLRPKMLSDIFSFSFTLLLPNCLLISIRIYSGIARFPCDSMAFLLVLLPLSSVSQRPHSSQTLSSRKTCTAVVRKSSTGQRISRHYFAVSRKHFDPNRRRWGLAASDRNCPRRIFSISYRDHVTNNEVRRSIDL